MSEQEKQEGQKTVVSFVSGLLIGGLLVWAFGGSPKEDKQVPEGEAEVSGEVTEVTGETATEEASTADEAKGGAEMVVGSGSLSVANQAAGSVVALTSATYPTEEGWIAVRVYTEGKMGSILGASRYSKEQGLIPTNVDLLAPTVAGREYAVVFFSEDGNRDFNLDGDVQLETGMTTFKAE
jgi:hypothetical protein